MNLIDDTDVNYNKKKNNTKKNNGNYNCFNFNFINVHNWLSSMDVLFTKPNVKSINRW